MNHQLAGRDPIQLADFKAKGPQNYRNIMGTVDIEKLRMRFSSNPFGKFWTKDAPDLGKFMDAESKKHGISLKSILANKTIIDLGGGSEKLGSSLLFASSIGARHFINVDIDFPPLAQNPQETNNLSNWFNQNIRTNMGVAFAASDILYFLVSMQKNGNVSFMMNNVMGQEIYFPSHLPNSDTYNKYIADEFTKLVTPGNMVFGMSSLPLMALSEKDGWKICGKDSDSSVIFAIRQ